VHRLWPTSLSCVFLLRQVAVVGQHRRLERECAPPSVAQWDRRLRPVDVASFPWESGGGRFTLTAAPSPPGEGGRGEGSNSQSEVSTMGTVLLYALAAHYGLWGPFFGGDRGTAPRLQATFGGDGGDLPPPPSGGQGRRASARASRLSATRTPCPRERRDNYVERLETRSLDKLLRCSMRNAIPVPSIGC